ncbi:Tetratricopeptide repeat protein [Actibacterium lipolyticum]|uniref:Tetratricopeptide repeat protein n=2 Tax=Actibacterium lipolyticum TaxID=1524263 RepID=A0A238KQN1_9RHOB|nr:Tetratricopeptide repeat protein [Actibacterium lipolyticum]
MVNLSQLPRLLQQQDWPAAERLLRRAAKDKAATAAVFYNLGKVLEAAGKPAQTAAWYRKAVAKDPNHANAWFELGRAQLANHDFAGAEGAFAKAAALSPDDGDALLNLARIRLRLGKWDTARAAWAQLPESAERTAAMYRIAAELGAPTAELRRALLADPAARATALKALTRTAKGSLPLRLG